VALGAVFVVLLTALPFDERIVTSIVVGPLAGMAVHLLWRSRRSYLRPT
jgi:hypothetical protein